MVQIDDLVKPRPEKIVLSTVSPLIRKHRNLRLKASSETGNHSDFIKSICKKTDVAPLKTGDIEYLRNSKNHCGADDTEFFTGDEFGTKVSIATPLNHSKGGQFIAHAKALPGNPNDGHTLEAIIPDIERQLGAAMNRLVADKGYRGHKCGGKKQVQDYLSSQKRGVTEAIKRDLKRRSAVEPVIGHAKSDHRMDRNCLKGAHRDASNAVLAAAGYNFRHLLPG